MVTRAPKNLVLVAAAVAVVVVLGVLLLGTGRSGGVALPTGEDPGAPGTFHRVDVGGAPGRVDAPARAPDSASGLPAQAAVEGKVRDAAGTPLPGVEIAARLLDEPSTAEARFRATTDARGNFALELLADAVAELSFSGSGYRPSRQTVRAPSSGLDVVLERSPTLRGRVVRRDGTPVGGALVRWSNPHLALGAGETTSTAADGRFAFRDVPWGLDLEVLAPDALPVYRSVPVTWGMRELVVTADGGREATGTVVDVETGAGIAGASVELWYYQSTYTAEGRRGGRSQHAETVTTRADGGFTLTKLPSTSGKRGPAWLWVTAPGRAPHWKLVPSPERADELKVALHPAGSVRGRVVDASGAPVPGQRIYAEAQAQSLCDAGPNQNFRRQDGGYSLMWNTRRPEAVAPIHTEREAFTDSRGTYVIDGIPCPAGGGEVTIALPDGYPRVTVVARPGEVAVADDLIRPEGLFRRWHGVVRDENGNPVAGVTVKISTARTTSDARGRFDLEVPGNVQGELTLDARASGYVTFRRGFVPSGGIFAECPEGGVTVTLARAVRLAVVVVDRGQRPVPNASVEVFPEGGLADLARGGPRSTALSRGRSDDRGAVLLQGVPDTCDVLVESPRSNTPAPRRILEGVAAGAGTLRVVLEDLDLSAGTATLALRVIDGRTLAPFEGSVLVEATSEKGSTRRLTKGPEIPLDGLSLGTWEVSVAAEGLGARSARVELFDDQRLDVRLGQGLAISGLVTCAAGPLARPVQVHAREVVSKRLTVTHTDAEGRFDLAGMTPGEYSLSVEPYESAAFARVPVRMPQAYASPAPVEVRIRAGTTPVSVTLPTVPVAEISAVVLPDAATRAAERSVWSWAQGLHFTVTDDQGRSVYAGGPSSIMKEAAKLMLCLPERRYTVAVRWRGEWLGERTLAAGESWRLAAR